VSPSIANTRPRTSTLIITHFCRVKLHHSLKVSHCDVQVGCLIWICFFLSEIHCQSCIPYDHGNHWLDRRLCTNSQQSKCNTQSAAAQPPLAQVHYWHTSALQQYNHLLLQIAAHNLILAVSISASATKSGLCSQPPLISQYSQRIWHVRCEHYDWRCVSHALKPFSFVLWPLIEEISVVGFWHHKRNTSYGVCTLGSPAVFQLGGWWVSPLHT